MTESNNMPSMCQELQNLVEELFQFLATLRRNSKSAEFDPSWVRQQVVDLIDQQQNNAQENANLSAQYEKVKYALVAFADEVAVTTDWEGAEDWEEELLELQYFGTAIAGTEFYARLEQLQPTDVEANAIFFMCLSLGFKGSYRSRPEERRELMQKLHRSIPGHLSSRNEELCPGIYNFTVESSAAKIPIVNTLHMVVLMFGLVTVAFIIGQIITSFAERDLVNAREQISGQK